MPDKTDTPVNPRSQAAIDAANAKFNTPQTVGGQGQYDPNVKGVQFIGPNRYGEDQTFKPNAFGEQQIGPNRFGETQTGLGALTPTERGAEYSKSLVINAGLKPESPEYNAAFQDFLQSNQLERVPDNETKLSSTRKNIAYNENYGYTGDVKVSPIVAGYSSKNPDLVNFELSKSKSAMQARDSSRSLFGDDKGGITTSQSKDKSFGTSWANKQPQSIGSKMFSGQQQIYRNSETEDIVKTKESGRAGSVYPSFANPDYVIGGSAKESGPKTKYEFGWKDIGSSQLVRGSTKESEVMRSEASRAAGISSPIDKGSSKSIILSENVNVTAKDEGKGQSAFQSTGVAPMSDKDFRAMLGQSEKKGATFVIFNQNKQIGTTSGPRAYHDIFAAQRQYGQKNVSIQTTYPQKEAVFIEHVRKNPDLYSKLPNSFYERMGKEGILTEKGVGEINSIFFTNYSKPEVKSTLNKSSVLPTELAKATDASYKGHFIDTSIGPEGVPLFVSQELGVANKGLGKPLLATSDKTNLGFGISAPIPGTAFREAGQNFLAFFGQGAKSTVAVGAAVATEGYDLFHTGKATDKTIAPNPNAFVEGIYYPNELWSEHATKKSESVMNQVHLFANEHGLSGKIPNTVENPKTSGAEFGTLLGVGVMAYGLKEAVPLRATSIPLKVAKESASPAFPTAKPVPMARSISFGYGGKSSRELISKVPGSTKYGKLSPKDYFPEGYYLKSQATRNEEIATGDAYAVSKLTSPEFQAYAETTGRSIPGTAKATANFIELKTLADASGEYKQYKKEIPTANERVTSQVGKAILESNASRYNIINKLRVFTTGRGAVGQGSTFGNLFTHPKVLAKTEALSPVHDIDFVKGNTVSENNPILAFFNDRQARALASSAQTAIEKEQGISEQRGVGFHSTETLSQANDIINKPTTKKSKRGGFFVMNKANAIGQFGNKVLKVEFNPNDVLFYKDIPKRERKGLIPKSKNWLEYQNNVMSYAQSKGYNIVEKPYYNTRKGAGTNPEANTKEIIFINENALKSIKNIELLPEMQLTRAEGGKIYDVANEGKLAEFITQSDTASETPSALKPTGNILGKPINFKVYKTPIEGSKIKGPHYGGQHAEETGLSQILALGTSETIKEQGPTPTGPLGNLRNKFFLGPKTFGQGKELVRTLGKFETKAIEYKSNPVTRAKGERMMELIKEQKDYYGPLYGIDWNKPISGSDFGMSSSYYKGPSKASQASSKSFGPASSIVLSSGKSSVSTKSALGSKSSISAKSRSSMKSLASMFSSKSELSGKSNLSSKSGISGLSGKSGKSALSGLSGLSSLSGPSGKSSVSAFSGLSGPSGRSGSSSRSGPSGFSGPSGRSASSLFGPSSFTNLPNVSPRIIPKGGQLPIKRKFVRSDRFTNMFSFGVKNPFLTALNLKPTE